MAPIDRRRILSLLEMGELTTLANTFNINYGRSSLKEDLVELLATTEQATLGQMLISFPRKRLKALCRIQGLDDGGREKSVIVTRLLGLDPNAPPPPKPVPPIRRRRKVSA